MHKSLIAASIVAAALTLPQMASAADAPSTQNKQSMQTRVKTNLEQAGFTDIKIIPSSFRVQAKDKDGHPIVMFINPDSVTELTELSDGTRTSSGANDSLDLTVAQRHELWQGLSKQAAKESAPAGFTAKVGEAVPSSIKLQSVPTSLSSQAPAVKSYDYAMLQDELLIVDPSSKKVVGIITQ